MQALEERVTFLEEEVRRLQTQMTTQMMRQAGAVSGKTAPDFLVRFSGIFGDDPTFAEATRLGRAWREEDNSAEADSSAEAEEAEASSFFT